MALKERLITARKPAPPKLIVYGQPGVGKTTLAAQAKATLIDCENGAGAVPGLTRTPYLESWTDIRPWLEEFAFGEEQPPSVVAVDTIDWMIERVCEHVVLELDPKAKDKDGNVNLANTLGSAHGGYYKAREVVQNIVYLDVFPLLNRIINRGSVVLLLAHASNEKMTTPEGHQIRIAAPDMPQWISQPFIEWADCVLFANYLAGKRTIRTAGTGNILAKNRYSMPDEIELSWDALKSAICTGMDAVSLPQEVPAQA